jgi:dihydrofolate synthase / folylpolyglutamate synthase
VFERYREAVDYLQRRLWHDLPIMPVERALQARIRTLLAHFGDPHRTVPVIHVGGSAGKGSTATMIASILRAAGLRTGLYTSPHLQTFIERIDVDGQLIDPDRFAELVLGLEPLVRKMHIDVLDGIGFGRPSLVEVAFAVGMKHFADEQCDVAVIEVGLGGRTDCTNVFGDPIPVVTVLTNVEYEHRERLGPGIADIAREKADIIKGGTVITAARRREALDVIEKRCCERGATLWRLGRDIHVSISNRDIDGTTFQMDWPHGSIIQHDSLPLIGDHHVADGALSIAAVTAFADARGLDDERGFDNLYAESLTDGLNPVRINARLETVQHNPRVILDGAHNPVEAKATAAAIRDHWFPSERGAQPPSAVDHTPHSTLHTPQVHLVVGILADKDQPAMVREFASVADTVVVTQPPLGVRIGEPTRIIEGFRKRLPHDAVTYEPSPERALDIALRRASKHDIVCVTGSMFLAGALRERWVPEEQILRTRSSAIA